MMTKIKFEATIIKLAQSHGVIIPKAIVNLMEIGEKYEFSIKEKEVKKNGNNKKKGVLDLS